MDFMSDALFDGRPFRLATVPRANFRAFHVFEILVADRGKPKTIRVDNGPEFGGHLLDQMGVSERC